MRTIASLAVVAVAVTFAPRVAYAGDSLAGDYALQVRSENVGGARLAISRTPAGGYSVVTRSPDGQARSGAAHLDGRSLRVRFERTPGIAGALGSPKQLGAAELVVYTIGADGTIAGPEGQVWRKIGPQPAGAFARAGDAIDRTLGFDATGPKAIHLRETTDADFASMESKVRALEAGERPLDAKQRERLLAGKVVKEWNGRPDGLTEERTIGLVDVPLDEFLRRIPVSEWGRNLADWKGGELRSLGNGRQIERMVLRSPGKDLDMTKIEQLSEERGPDGKVTKAQVRWEVLHSDNGSVVKDVGTLRFERFGDKTLVTWHSAHKLGTAPFGWGFVPATVKNALLGYVLTDYFGKTIARYGEIAGAPR